LTRRHGRPRGFYTDELGRIRPIMGSGRGLPPRSKRYLSFVSIETPEAAKLSIKRLEEEFNKAKRRSKHLRILSIIASARDKAKAIASSPITPKTLRRKASQIAELYDQAFQKLSKKYFERWIRGG